MKYYGDLWLETLDNLHLASEKIPRERFAEMCMVSGMRAVGNGEAVLYDDLQKTRLYIWHDALDRVVRTDPKKYGELLKKRLGAMPEPKKTDIYH